jgi:epoxide hydrolase
VPRSGVGREQERSTVPTGVALFARDDFRTNRSLVERANRIVHWAEFDTGGHFAAMQAPDVLTADLRTLFRGLR